MTRSRNDTTAVITVIDDDESIRESLPELLRSGGYAVQVFASAESFRAALPAVAQTQCLILDVAMPNMSGPELQAELQRSGIEIPTVYITAQTDDGLRTQLIAGGAVDILHKPFSEESLFEAVRVALNGG